MKRFARRYGSILLALSVVLVLSLLIMPVSTAFWSQVLGISGSVSTGNWEDPNPPHGSVRHIDFRRDYGSRYKGYNRESGHGERPGVREEWRRTSY